MNFLEFISSAFWPAVVLIIFWTLKKPLRMLIKRIKRISYGDSSVEIDEILQGVANKINASEQTESPKPELVINAAVTNLTMEPEGEVILAWMALEAELMKAYGKLKLKHAASQHASLFSDPGKSTEDKLSTMFYLGSITPSEFDMIRDLMRIRNEVVHRFADVSRDEAMSFRAFSDKIISRLQIDGP